MSERDDLTCEYWKALGIPEGSGKTDHTDMCRAALFRAHEMRKFEIDNYWKRATYFWSFQAIAFGVLGFILKDGKLPDSIQLLQIPAAIGAVSGYVGYLSAKGSKYWQENWESHVDILEVDVEGRLTQLIWSDGKVSYSVSRLNQMFMGIITIGWILLIAIGSSGGLPDIIAKRSAWWVFALLILILVGIGTWSRQRMTGFTIFENSWEKQSDTWPWSWRLWPKSDRRERLLVRDTKAKDAEKPDK